MKKLSNTGEELWQLTFNNSPNHVFEGRSALLSNDDILVSFFYDDTTNPEYRAYRISPTGDFIWTAIIPRVIHQEIDYRIEIYKVIPHSPDDIRLYFRMNYYDENDPPSAKNGYISLDSLGNERERIYFDTQGEYRFPYSIIPIKDSNYIQAYRPTLPSFLLSLRYELMNKTYSPVWTYEIGPEDFGSGGPICADLNSNIYFTWKQDTTGEGGPFNQLPSIISLNQQGEWMWTKHFGEDRGVPVFYDIIYTTDHNIIACGQEGNSSLSGGNYRTGWIVCIDTTGTKLWERRYVLNEASDAGNNFSYIIEADDGGLILFGELNVPTGGTDVYIFKTDSLGCLADECELYNYISISTNIINIYEKNPEFYCLNNNSELTLISYADLKFYEQLQYEIIGLNGQVMMYGLISEAKTKIDISELISGLYFIRVLDNNLNTVSILKMVK
ncbi:MAG: T9SS type A sorting domain-containing protein [Bacteroidota bacterium]|nr:T9SS type A sorting domain-containing protein [Bacteroidota bacterium]